MPVSSVARYRWLLVANLRRKFPQITSKLHLETAIFQAILAESQNALRTRTVHSEILYNLNPTHNVSERILFVVE